MKARTLISHGCQGFLASVMDTSLESPNIENLFVVREFADVFPDELPGLPPAREIEFGIELIPGAEPISKAPYRMAPVELKELKEQLQEMLENGFIRPSVSPWVQPVLILFKKKAWGYALYGIIMDHIKGGRSSPNGETYYGDGCMKSFSGLNGYYRVLLRVSPRLALHLTVMRKGDEFVVGRFGVFQRYCDVEERGWVGFGTWEGDRLRFKTYLKRMKVNYPTQDLELAAVVFALKIEDIYLEDGWELLKDLTLTSSTIGQRLGCWLCVRGLWLLGKYEDRVLTFMLQIKEAQRDDGELWAIVQNVEDGKHTEFSVDDDGIVWFEDRLCVPNDQATSPRWFMTEAIVLHFIFHPRQCQIEHQRASGLLQPLEIPMWKWDEISMDFVTGLPTTQKRHDAIWVVVDRLTKVLLFSFPIRKKNYGISKLAEIFQQEIVRLHGTPTAIVSDRDPKFTSRFWKGLQKAWGTRLKFSTAFHRPSNRWSVKKGPFRPWKIDGLCFGWYGKCRAPICWDEVGERLIEGPELIEITNEKVAVAKEKLKEARSRRRVTLISIRSVT
ncbi:retrotransposable element Tf2 [Tanacetum coccineum]